MAYSMISHNFNIIQLTARTNTAIPKFCQPDLEATPWIQLKLSQPRCLREVQFLFDSNLSREIMISLSETHLTEQEKSTPSTLVKDFTIEFILNGKIIDTMTIHDNYQRRVLVTRKVPIQCDTLKVIIQQTYGTCTPKVFEIRLYE